MEIYYRALVDAIWVHWEVSGVRGRDFIVVGSKRFSGPSRPYRYTLKALISFFTVNNYSFQR
jgi:hypothetical protein